jgi:hypothetical protein
MNNPVATGRYVQTALIQAPGELCLKARPQRKNAAARPTRSESQSAGEDIQPLSRHPLREARHTPDIPKTIQSP